jgi:hypothetical protein
MISEKMLTYADHLGLYVAQIGASGEALETSRRRSPAWP